MDPPYPSYTTLWHRGPYASISPKRPELSANDKTVVITGGGQGIGRAIALSFAQAGAARIHLLARRLEPMNETKSLLNKQYPGTVVETHSVDVVDEKGLQQVAARIGGWDVLILNAAVIQFNAKALDGNVEDWWRVFEINIKGNILMTRAFFPSQHPGARIIGVTSSGWTYPSSFLVGSSAYQVSKLAQAKALEFLSAEYPDTHFGLFHPGTVETDMIADFKAKDQLSFDEPALAGDFAVWMASDEALFTRGKFLWANWNVDELKAKADQVKSSADLMIVLKGMGDA